MNQMPSISAAPMATARLALLTRPRDRCFSSTDPGVVLVWIGLVMVYTLTVFPLVVERWVRRGSIPVVLKL